jgi:hypothetical protein
MNLRFIRHVVLSVLLVFAFVLVSSSQLDAAQKTVHVKGYTKKDGRKVKPHDRTAPKSEGTSDDKKSRTKTPKATKIPKAPKVSASTARTRSDRCDNCDRDEHGKIVRSGQAKDAFKRTTGYPHGRPGYVIDHVQPLACGGLDVPSNMQWQTKTDAAAKDKTERASCR